MPHCIVIFIFSSAIQQARLEFLGGSVLAPVQGGVVQDTLWLIIVYLPLFFPSFSVNYIMILWTPSQWLLFNSY